MISQGGSFFANFCFLKKLKPSEYAHVSVVKCPVSPPRYWRAPVLWRDGIQWTRELVGLAWGVRQEGVSPDTLGSSGIWVRYELRCSLKSVMVMLVRFRISFCNELNSLGPQHWNLETLLIVLILGGPFIFLIWHDRPILVFASFWTLIPQLGAIFLGIFQMYRIF